jgi:hypothetical protein
MLRIFRKWFFAFIIIFLTLMEFSSIEAKALLLYKGSEQGYGYYILVKYFVPVLEELIESYEYSNEAQPTSSDKFWKN